MGEGELKRESGTVARPRGRRHVGVRVGTRVAGRSYTTRTFTSCLRRSLAALVGATCIALTARSLGVPWGTGAVIFFDMLLIDTTLRRAHGSRSLLIASYIALA